MHKLIFALSLFIHYSKGIAQQTTFDSTKVHQVCLSKNEVTLFELITAYRKENGLPYIPLSTQLSYVAQTHAKDLFVNKPNQHGCNMHSWSNNGPWAACCYSPDHKNPSCMWNKPKELTNYTDNGFEIAHNTWHSDDANYEVRAYEALDGWKHSTGHNNVILNKSIWKDEQWNAIGVGIYKGYAIVWFGREKDAEGSPMLCK
jgi:uncharacterized protein YkwD